MNDAQNKKLTVPQAIGLALSALVIPLMVFIAWDQVLASIPSSYSMKRQAIDRDADKVEVINLGTSREYDGIDPSAFPAPALNLANNGQDIYYDVQVVRLALQKLPKLKLILFSIFPNTLIRDINDIARVTFYYRDYGISPDEASWTHFLDPFRYVYSRAYTPVQGAAWLIRHEDINLLETESPLGWTAHRGTRVRTIPHLEGGVANLNSSQMIDPKYEKTIQRNIAMLKGLKADLGAHPDVKLVFFTVPTLPAYHQGLVPAGDARFRGIITDLKDYFGTQYYDYLRDPRFKYEEFADGSHLNVLGAKRFSNILAREVVTPNLRKP